MGNYDFELNQDIRDSNVILINMIKENAVVLEFGPYKGRMTKYLKEQLNCKVYGVEIDQEAAEVSKQYAEKMIIGDIEDYRWFDELKGIKFDNIIFADVLEHLINPEEVLQKAKQLLKFDGSINISIPNITHNSIIMNLYRDQFNYTKTGILDQTHLRFFGYNNIVELIYKLGMVPTKQDATYAAPGKNEISVSYADFDLALQQELRKRRYGDVYQFVFEIKKQEYVEKNNVIIEKNIKSNIQNIERLIVDFITTDSQIGDIYKEYKVDISKMTKLHLEIRQMDVKNLILTLPDAECILKVNVFATQEAKKSKLKIIGNIELEAGTIIFITPKLNQLIIDIDELYDYIDIELEPVIIGKEELEHIYVEGQKQQQRLKETYDKMIESQKKELEEWKHNYEESYDVLRKSQEKFIIMKKQYEENHDDLRKFKEELVIMEKQYNVEVQRNNDQKTYCNELEKTILQKEANNQYLIEALKEKDERLNQITKTRGWIALEKIRRFRNKIIKYSTNPRLLKYRIFGAGAVTKEMVSYSKDNSNTVNELISVVIPIYNRTIELVESIESILNQTYQNIEVLLICDGSPQETLEVVERYRKHPKVRIYKFNNNSGNAVRGRNKAIKEARGQYLAFQDSDDIAELNRLELSLKWMKEYNVDVVYGGWRAKLDGTRQIDLVDGQEVMSPDCDYEFLKQICVPCQSTVMVKIDALRDVGGLKDKMRYREDHEMWLRLAYFGYKFKAIPQVLTNLRLHANNLELSFKDNDSVWEELTMKEHKIKNHLKPKIGYIIAGCDISGGLSVICKHANELLERKYDVTFICTSGAKKIDWYPNQKVEIISIDEMENNYDILVATFWLTAYDLERLPAKRKIYFVQSDESKFYEHNSKEEKMVLDTYQKDFEYITMANWIKALLKEKFQKDAVVVHNGIDLDMMYQTEPIVPKGDKLRVLIEGPTTIPFKGVKKAFEVVGDLDCEVWCVSSDGRLDPTWKCDMFFEKVKYENMKNIYSSCDVLLKLSEVESFCLPALEMMACGGIPIVARVNGVDEFLEDGKNGFIVEQGDLEKPKQLLRMMIRDRDLKDNMAQAAIKTVKDWTWQESIDILEEQVINAKLK